MEHRWGYRSDIGLPTRLRQASPAAAAGGHIVNLSISGALIRTDLEASLFGTIEVEINRDWIAASVVRLEPRLIAVEWFELAPPLVVRQLEVAALKLTSELASSMPPAAA